MTLTFRTKSILIILLVLSLPNTSLYAQLGKGWVEYFPGVREVQMENSVGYATYNKTDGVETFTLTANPSGTRQRCEARVDDDYNSGTRQFEGEVWIKKGSGGVSGNSGPNAAVCVHQVWQWLMIIVFNLENGDLRQHSNGKMITNAYERWIRITTIHDVEKHWAAVYIDSVKRWEGTVSGDDGGYNNGNFYHKYGIYNGAASNPEVKWRNTRYFKDGTAPGQKQSQNINFPALPVKKPSDPDFSPNAVASSGLTVLYTSSNPQVATIVNNNIHITGLGITTITAKQAGDATYNAAEVSQTLFVTNSGTTALPAPWTSNDIGSPALAGNTKHADGNFVLTGAGADVWSTTDEFHYVSQQLNGDGEIIARVNSVSNTNTNAKAGIMFRESNTANSPFAYITQRPDNQVQFDARQTSGTAAIHVSSLSGTTTGTKFLKLVRSGNTITGYYSTAASTGPWTLLGSSTITMTANIQTGIFVTSHNTTSLCTAIIDNVIVSNTAKQNQIITFPALPVKKMGDPDFAPGATASSNLPIKYASSNLMVATIANNNIHILGPGTSTITASQEGNNVYNAAANVSSTLTVTSATGNNPTLQQNYQLSIVKSSGKTIINYTVVSPENTEVAVFNTQGEKVLILVNHFHSEGKYSVNLNADALPKGMYLVKLTSKNFRIVKKLLF